MQVKAVTPLVVPLRLGSCLTNLPRIGSSVY